jgi:hypothetical protein
MDEVMTMPKTLEEIQAHADELSRRFEDWEPDDSSAVITPLGELYQLAARRAEVESQIADAVRRAHESGSSWRVIGNALGTSASAARQRYGGEPKGPSGSSGRQGRVAKSGVYVAKSATTRSFGSGGRNRKTPKPPGDSGVRLKRT